jgi:hypothetical protein
LAGLVGFTLGIEGRHSLRLIRPLGTYLLRLHSMTFTTEMGCEGPVRPFMRARDKETVIYQEVTTPPPEIFDGGLGFDQDENPFNAYSKESSSVLTPPTTTTPSWIGSKDAIANSQRQGRVRRARSAKKVRGVREQDPVAGSSGQRAPENSARLLGLIT